MSEGRITIGTMNVFVYMIPLFVLVLVSIAWWVYRLRRNARRSRCSRCGHSRANHGVAAPYACVGVIGPCDCPGFTQA